MPIPAARLATCIGALVTTVFLAGLSAGVAAAAPDDAAANDGTSQVSPGGLLQRTVAVLQDSRAPHQPVRRVLAVSKAVINAVLDRAHAGLGATKSVDAGVESQLVGTDEAPVVDPRRSVKSSSGSVAVFQLPAVRAFALPMPTLPGAPATSYSIDVTSPVAAYSTARSTSETVNTLVTDAVTPYSPFGPYLQPKPDPQPQLRVYEAEPAVIDVAGGGGGNMTMSVGMPDLSVLQTPLLVPAAIRLAPPRPVPAGASAQVISGGAVGPPVPTVRGPVPQGGAQAAETASGIPGSPMGNTALRQGFPQYLRNARLVEVASVALPGVAGLLALTTAGGMIGYRQANSGRYVRADAARFLT